MAKSDVYATVRRTMTLDDDPEGLAAEAFQHGAFDSEKHSREVAHREIKDVNNRR